MSEWHHEHPDDPGTWDTYLEGADMIRQRQRDERFLEAVHPESCACSFCTPRRPFDQAALEHQADEEARAEAKRDSVGFRPTDERMFFDQWWETPHDIARLLRWLKLRDKEPADIPDFIESAETWFDEYYAMLAAEKRAS